MQVLPIDQGLRDLCRYLGKPFGILAESNTTQLKVIAWSSDVAVGDLFLLPSHRGNQDRFYIFRTTQYANITEPNVEMSDLARVKLTMQDAYLTRNLRDEQLIELTGIVLGYAEREGSSWRFHRPRRLPEHLSEVYQVHADNPMVQQLVTQLLHEQLGSHGLLIGHLLAGEQALPVEVHLPPFALSHHIGIFGRTGAGKSNLMMVLLAAVLQHNRARFKGTRHGPATSILAIDPHDEFRKWHANTGGADGLAGIVAGYTEAEHEALIAPFYYLTARSVHNDPLARRLVLSRADVMPQDVASIMAFSEQQHAFSNQQFSRWGEAWIPRVMMGDTMTDEGFEDTAIEFLPGTVSAVQRRLEFLRRGHTRVFTPYDPDLGVEYQSLLPEIICALEQGRVLAVETTLMTELEQFLVTTVIARTLFALRRALRSVETAAELEDAIRQALGNDTQAGQVGLSRLADELVSRVRSGKLPYLTKEEGLVSPDKLPVVNVVVEEAPSVLNPQRMQFGSVFRDISRQGRKFGIGLTVVSQQVSEIDPGVLTQLNTELFMSLGNEMERKGAVRNASADLAGFEQELQVMSRGQAILTASYKDVPLPIQIPAFDTLQTTDQARSA